ncbi:hypothetical protein [Amycolatopsis plumensis]
MPEATAPPDALLCGRHSRAGRVAGADPARPAPAQLTCRSMQA